MPISEPMSNSDWMQLYQTNLMRFDQTETPPPTTTIAATITTTATTTTTTSSRNNNNLSLDQGRISKPIRRRSRASRRTPTTLFNTDTTNFRAMVQQFTGGPAAARSLQFPNTTDFAQHIGGAATAAAAPSSGFRVQYNPDQLQQQQYHMFMVNNMHGGGGGGGRGGGDSSHAPPGPPSTTNGNGNYNNYLL